MRFGIREILFGVLLMGVPAGAWRFVFEPSNAHSAQMREQIRGKQEKLRKLNHVVGTVGNLRKEIASLEKAVAFLRSKLPSEKEIDRVLQETWRLAEKSKMVTKSIRTIIGKKAKSNYYARGAHAEQPIEINLEGDFDGFYAFLQALENQPRIIRISRMNLVTTPESPEGHIQAEFDMSVFFERDRKD